MSFGWHAKPSATANESSILAVRLNALGPAADTSCMPRVPLIDRLLLWPFGVARNLFFLQGLAFGCASAAAFAWTRSDVSPWIIRSVVVAGLMSGAFVVAGVLLSWMRSWTPTRDRWSDPAESVWPTALGGSLVLIAGLTVVASAGLPGLWRQILAQLSAIEFWEGLTTPSQFGGIVTLPILLALFVPALVTLAALFSFFFPLVLLARLRSRPLMFPTMLSMGAVCQSALVATGWLAAMLLRELIQAFNAAMLEAPNPEVVQVSDQLARAVSTLMTTATMLVLPAAALVGWAVFLRPSSNAAGQFGRDEAPGTVELPNLEANYKEEPFVAFSAEAAEPKSSVMLARSLRRLGVDGSWSADAAVRGDGQSAIPSGVRDVHTRARRVGAGRTAGDPGHVQRCAGLGLDAVARLLARRAQYRRHLPRRARDQPVGVRAIQRGARSKSFLRGWAEGCIWFDGPRTPTSAASSGTARSSSASVCGAARQRQRDVLLA